MDCSLPGSSAHGIFQAKVLEWGAIAFSSMCGHLHVCAWMCAYVCVHVWVGRLMLIFTRCLCEFEVSPRSYLQKGRCDLWGLAVTSGHRQS